MLEDLEGQIINLVATDRLYVPSSSFDGKLKRRRNKAAESIEIPEKGYKAKRVYARIEEEDKQKARGMRDGIEEFSEKYPKYGAVLKGIIEQKRIERERHLYFGMLEGKRLTNEDYMTVLEDIGLSPVMAEKYSEVAIEINRTLVKKREEKERSVLIGSKEEREDE